MPGRDRATLIGFFAINVHWIEIGGIQTNSTDIFMEGLQLRSIKLWSKGEPIEEVYRIIENNTRMPNELLGDIAAQLAGCLLGRDLTAELADKYGIATFNRAVELILDQSEAAARAFIRAMPDGVYRDRDLSRQRPLGGEEPVPIIVKVIVAGDELTVDYTDIAAAGQGPDQFRLLRRRPDHRARRVQISAWAPTRWRTKARSGRSSSCCRPASCISADPTAPMFMYPTPFPTVIDAVIKALETALPARVPGGHFGTHSGVRFYGRRAERHRSSTPTTAATAAGAPARPTTAPARSAPWRTATPASSRSSCRNR